MNPKFKIGDIVWYQLPFGKGTHAKARVTAVGRTGVIGAPLYSIWRLDNLPITETHHVLERRLSRPHNTTIPPFPYLTNKECPHV